MNIRNNSSIGELMEPEAIAFSFAAPGWMMLLLLILLVLLAFAIWKRYQYKKNKYRRVAINELNALNNSNNEISAVILNTIFLLKRVAIAAYGRKEVASINGSFFFQFLKSKTNTAVFSDELEIIFTKHLYEGNKAELTNNELELLHRQSINWINEHDV
ncbi:DUF4381 domain-containing protein [Labilibacter marinus]|uniref:DUF4381 domain-containing protein n=1 Tax=Labilibacter marinus TaxID=1477105 RepID=UPI0009502943|nr:DUF4381 domain-containing protein [Labilibacter marinus]